MPDAPPARPGAPDGEQKPPMLLKVPVQVKSHSHKKELQDLRRENLALLEQNKELTEKAHKLKKENKELEALNIEATGDVAYVRWIDACLRREIKKLLRAKDITHAGADAVAALELIASSTPRSRKEAAQPFGTIDPSGDKGGSLMPVTFGRSSVRMAPPSMPAKQVADGRPLGPAPGKHGPKKGQDGNEDQKLDKDAMPNGKPAETKAGGGLVVLAAPPVRPPPFWGNGVEAGAPSGSPHASSRVPKAPPPPKAPPRPPPVPGANTALIDLSQMDRLQSARYGKVDELYKKLKKKYKGKDDPTKPKKPQKPAHDEKGKEFAKKITEALQKEGPFKKAIDAIIEQQQERITMLKDCIVSLKLRDMDKVVAVVDWMDKEMSYLSAEGGTVDELMVVAQIPGWPKKKERALHDAASMYKDLQAFVQGILSVPFDGDMPAHDLCQVVRDKLKEAEKVVMLTQKERDTKRMIRRIPGEDESMNPGDDETTMRKEYELHHIPIDWLLDDGMIRKIKRTMRQLATKLMQRMVNELHEIKDEEEHSALLLSTVEVANSVHQFANGFGPEARAAFNALAACNHDSVTASDTSMNVGSEQGAVSNGKDGTEGLTTAHA